MKAATAIGIAAGLGGLALAGMMEGVSPTMLINIPAIIIVLVGTACATLASVGMDAMKNVPALYKLVFSPPELDLRARVELIVSLAEQARREGLLALDAQLAEIDDAFTRKGLQLVVDGTDPELVREILEAEIDGMQARHAIGATTFEKGGGYAPTLGILGAVMGLIHVLQNLADPAGLGPSISVAFIATLLGVGMANVVLLPVSSRLKALSTEEVELRTLTLEGILAVQAGDNPRVVGDKLMSYVPPALRGGEDDADEGAAASRSASDDAAAQPAAEAA
jgi:chemotaxis protein MotA